ncbi:EAL and HDOD domain-containing protein [Mangrovibacillus cuniculi]|uniref:HDOD domain-containing protein n=1 Tax=Mangrovibacillus cuniculi TaxID=2593652 RepID=A0A7S8HF92_9BACI|nr:HDOD domain-containing protein [Mangrovibacillus cuniculi]QPC46583.1 HDOD domain-containing protein [Mangrovibacillus cuniculi]
MEVFVARQPIFNKNKDVYAYELLYRNNQDNTFPHIDGDQATTDVIINSFLNIGIDKLSNGLPCFVNFTENLLKLKLPTYFSPRDLVIEILESVEPSKEILSTIEELKRLGYKIALDDFILKDTNERYLKLLKSADYVKVDFVHSTLSERRQVEGLAKKLNIVLLAEKIESLDDYLDAIKHGYSLFQGYFFSKPFIVSSRDVPSYFQSYLPLLQYLTTTVPDVKVVATLIEKDLSLSYKLLKLINSPSFRPKHKISSIQQAIVLLGFIEVRKWIYVLAVRDQKSKLSGPSVELLKMSLMRGRMCELIASHNGERQSSSYFLTGLFSLMDVILGIPMESILEELPLQDDITDSLKGQQTKMNVVLSVVKQMEKGNVINSDQLSGRKNINNVYLNTFYKESAVWADQLLDPSLEEMVN